MKQRNCCTSSDGTTDDGERFANEDTFYTNPVWGLPLVVCRAPTLTGDRLITSLTAPIQIDREGLTCKIMSLTLRHNPLVAMRSLSVMTLRPPGSTLVPYTML